jgi:hypothetical protein
MLSVMGDWSFLTNHARVLLCIAHDPGVRLRDIATALGITERSAYGIVTDLADAGYVMKEKDGRRNRYQIRDDLPLRGSTSEERTISEVLDIRVDANALTGGRGQPMNFPLRKRSSWRALHVPSRGSLGGTPRWGKDGA